MHAYLRVVSGPDQGRVFNLVEGTTLSIGRGEKTDTRLTDGAASRLHCEVRCEGGAFLLTDLESVGGTFVGGQKIQEHSLKHGEELQVGNTRLKLYTSAIADTQTLVEAEKSAFHPAIRIDEGVLTGDDLALRARADPGAGPLRHGLQGPQHPRRQGRGHQGALRRFHPGRREPQTVHARDEDRRRGATSQPDRPLWRGQAGRDLLVRQGVCRGRVAHQGDRAAGDAQDDQLAIHVLAGRAGRRGAGSPPREAHHPSQRLAESIQIRSKDKVAKLGDMMLAKVVDGTEAKTPAGPVELMGNVAYMAPERTRGDMEVDIRADIYSLGATLYTLLTGRPPFEGKTLVETVAKIRQEDPIPPKKFQDSIPDEFQDVVEKMLAKRPEMRYQTPATWRGRWIGWRKPRPRPPTRTNPRSSGYPAIPVRPSDDGARSARFGMGGGNASRCSQSTLLPRQGRFARWLILTRSVSEGLRPFPSLTLRVSM